MSEDTVDDLMLATYRALCTHGYADLTMQDIAAETDKGTGTLHYHFDGKGDLLESFLGFLLDRFEERTERIPGETPAERLHALFEELLTPSDEASAERFRTAIIEIKAQAPYNEAYRDRLSEFDRAMRERIATLIEAGIEDRQFRDDIDPDEAASFLVTVFHGAQTRAAAVDRSLEGTRRSVHAYIDDALRATDDRQWESTVGDDGPGQGNEGDESDEGDEFRPVEEGAE